MLLRRFLELRALVVKDHPQAKYLIANIMKTQHRATEEITIHRVLLVVAISMIFTLTPELRQNVLAAMDEIVASYRIVSVADYFDLVGVDGPWTGNNYGWTDNIRNARVINTRDGYTIKFPRANPID